MLGYSKNDLFNQNINRIQPKCYSDFHDEVLKGYLEKAESRNIGIERLVFPITKNGYIRAFYLMIKVQ